MRRFIVSYWVFAPKLSIYFLNFTIFDPVPNSGGVHFKIAKWVRIWDADQYTKLVPPLYRVFQILILIYTINFECDDFKWIKIFIEILIFTIFPTSQIPGAYILKSRNGAEFGSVTRLQILEYHLFRVSQISHLIYAVNIK